MVSPKVSLSVNGKRLDEWTSVSISRSLTSLADSFSLGYVDVNTRKDYPIKEGDECVVSIGLNKVITGYVDVAEWKYSASTDGKTSHSFSVEGRSKSGDLVDSSVVPDPSTWKEKTFLTIARQICAPYGITPIVSANIDALVNTPIRRHSVEIGESPGDCLGRLAQKLGVLLRTTVDGKLEIGRPPGLIAASAIMLDRGGARIKSGSRRSDHRQRHDLYIAFGQNQGSSTVLGDAAREGKQSANDPRVTRYRPLVFIQDGSSTTGTLRRAAEWTRNTRAGQSERVSYKVVGWESAPGKIWEPGRTVICNDSLLRLKKKGLIVESVSFTQSKASGTETQIDLVNPEAFVGLTPPTKPRKKEGVLTW